MAGAARSTSDEPSRVAPSRDRAVGQPAPALALAGADAGWDTLSRLQRTIGNQAVQRLFAGRRSTPTVPIQRVLVWTNIPGPKGINWLRDNARTDTHVIDPTSAPGALRIFTPGEGNKLNPVGFYRPVEQDQQILQQLEHEVTTRMVTPMASAPGLAQAAAQLPKTNQIVRIAQDNYPQVVESLMDEGPVSTLANNSTVAGSLGAGPCVIVLIRAQSKNGRLYIGSTHLSSEQMINLQACRTSLLALVRSVMEKMQVDNDTLQSSEGYMVGGADYEDTEFEEYARLVVAAQQLRGTFNLVGARLPVNAGNEAINAYIRANGLIEYFQRVMGSSSSHEDDDDDDDDDEDQGVPLVGSGSSNKV